VQGLKNSYVGQDDKIKKRNKEGRLSNFAGDRRDFAVGSLWFAGREIIGVNSTFCLAKETPISYSKGNFVRV
jgi:hypothetical protein